MQKTSKRFQTKTLKSGRLAFECYQRNLSLLFRSKPRAGLDRFNENRATNKKLKGLKRLSVAEQKQNRRQRLMVLCQIYRSSADKLG